MRKLSIFRWNIKDEGAFFKRVSEGTVEYHLNRLASGNRKTASYLSMKRQSLERLQRYSRFLNCGGRF